MQPTKWQTQNKGVAKNAFNKAQAEPSKTQQTQQGRQSEMVRNTQPKPMGPKPPSQTRSSVDRQAHAEKLSAENKQARETKEKAPQKLTREEEIAQLNERFKNKAREKDMGR